ncbi:hypothetical protein Tco_0052438, partial [Tanacetum coccineum]
MDLITNCDNGLLSLYQRPLAFPPPFVLLCFFLVPGFFSFVSLVGILHTHLVCVPLCVAKPLSYLLVSKQILKAASNNYEVTCKEEAKRRNSRTKMKTFEESNKTSTIRRIQQGRYFVSAPARHKNAFLSIPYPALQGKLTLYAVSTYLDTAYPWIFRQYKYWTQIRSLVCKNILSTYYTFEDEFLRPRRAAKVNMDDPNIIMEEYIRLEEEKAHKRGKVYNWETAKYGKT